MKQGYAKGKRTEWAEHLRADGAKTKYLEPSNSAQKTKISSILFPLNIAFYGSFYPKKKKKNTSFVWWFNEMEMKSISWKWKIHCCEF